MPQNAQSEVRPHPFYFYLLVGAACYVFIETFSLLSPILFSFLLIVLVSLAVNPVIARMRTVTGGRKVAAGLVVTAFIILSAMTVWAFCGRRYWPYNLGLPCSA